jgi:polyphosphate kinase 2 (PPK2 family)
LFSVFAVEHWRSECRTTNNGKEVLQEKNKLKAEEYERELRKLQTKLVEMQAWVTASGA